MLFDTHTHLNDPDLWSQVDSLLFAARAVGVTRMVVPGYDRESSIRAMQLAEQIEFIYAAVGFHPHDAKDVTDRDLADLALWCQHEKVVAVGEIGLDYHYDNSPRDVQQAVFKEQISIAKIARLPIVIHDREAHADVITVLQETDAKQIGGIMHCYSASAEMMPQFLDLGFYISLAGPVTFKNGKRPIQVALEVPADRLLVETDAPYLTPEPYRGKQNQPAYVRYVAQKIADVRGISIEELEKMTYANAMRAFHLEA